MTPLFSLQVQFFPYINQNISIKRKQRLNDVWHGFICKLGDPLQHKMEFCIHFSSVVD